eukprot:1960425-Amphidinium_carterae.1
MKVSLSSIAPGQKEPHSLNVLASSALSPHPCVSLMAGDTQCTSTLQPAMLHIYVGRFDAQ